MVTQTDTGTPIVIPRDVPDLLPLLAPEPGGAAVAGGGGAVGRGGGAVGGADCDAASTVLNTTAIEC